MPARVLSEAEMRRLASLTDRFRPIAEDIVAQINETCADHRDCQILVVYGHRSIDEQLEIWARGRTMIDPLGSTWDPANWRQTGKVVTNAPPGSSPHNFGEALDVALIHNPKRHYLEDSDPRWFNIIGIHVEQHRMIWGGRWKKPRDLGHFEHPKWKELQFALERKRA